MYSNDPIFQQALQQSAKASLEAEALKQRITALRNVYYGVYSNRNRGREYDLARYRTLETINRLLKQLSEYSPSFLQGFDLRPHTWTGPHPSTLIPRTVYSHLSPQDSFQLVWGRDTYAPNQQGDQ